jgi:phage terminase large subunit-like protein
MVNEFIMYGPRKIDKTGLSAFIQLVFFLFGDFNSEIYALAMTQDQSKILFDRTKFMLNQVNVSDEGNPLFRMTEKVVDWLKKYRETIRNSKIVPLTGGGKAPDGTNTELLDWDELGSSPYVNGKSDMQAHINVCQSSMGMRRQPLTFGTTTAGTINTGPFIDMLEGRHNLLLKEFDYETGETEPSLMYDSQMCLLLEPDEYEKQNEEYIITSHALRRKINPMLGVIVQYDFYDREMAKARQDGEQKFAECVAKLFNVYKNNTVKDWIKPDEIRAIQVPMRIDECTRSQGWEVMVGMDFSKGDDLNGCSYLAKRWRDDLGEYEYFADMDAYMSEAAVEESPIRELLLKWSQAGWLHIVPGRTFDPAVVMDRIVELDDKDINVFGYGYDPYNAKTVINALTQWLVDVGLDPKQLIKPVRQNFATYSPAVKEFDYMIHRGTPTADGKVEPNPMIHLSANPLWPWEFGNCQLAESTDGMENMKPVKANASASCKVDNVQMLLSALILHDMADGSITPT